MILIEFFLGVIAVFVLLVLGLGLSLWFNIRHLNPFLRAQELRHPPQSPNGGGDVIEGEYRVIKEDERE